MTVSGGGWPVRGSNLDRTRNKQFCRENLRTLAGIAGDGVRYVELEWRGDGGAARPDWSNR